jgi:hypothetical protein
MFISISLQSLFKHDEHVFETILSFIAIFTCALLWIIKITFLNQDCTSKNAKFTNIKSLIRMVLFSFQNILLYFTLTNESSVIFVTVSLSFACISFVVSLIMIENID